LDHLSQETERYVRFKLTKKYIETIIAEGGKRLGDAYSGSDFSKWVEWAESYLKENGPGTWELPKFKIPDNQWASWGGQ
jgi:hypothetical protein